MSISSSDGVTADFFNYTDESLIGSISQAVRQNDIITLLRLLKKRKKNPLPLAADNRKWTALHIAASELQYKECLELLLQYSNSVLIDINDQTFRGETALHIACENGCEENVLILLQKGCDPRKTTLELDTALHTAAAKGYSRIVEYLLNYSANVNAQNWEKLTPLHLAIIDNHLETCHILLVKGADVRSTDLNGNTPLHFACQNGNLNIIRLLLNHNSETVNYKNYDGITPLMLAVQSSDISSIRHLLERGAETGIQNKYAKLALHFAAFVGKPEILQLILQSTKSKYIEEYLYSFPKNLQARKTYYSLTCCAIHSGSVECLAILINSNLPKSILQTPTVEDHSLFVVIYSPLSYVFSWFTEPRNEELNSYLNLLLEHKITLLDKFCNVLRVKWPHSRAKYICPFSRIFCDSWSISEQLYYFNLLNANGVTIDYCLQCYHDNSKPFDTFVAYNLYYDAVIDAVHKKNIEVVKLLMSNSAILEPDILSFCCRSKLRAYGSRNSILDDMERTRSIYQYLISLKPVYYKQVQHCHLDGFGRYPYSTVSEEFSKATLQQLCRTVIRQQLREATLEDNIRNFRRKILELPLPNSLKDYLLFKS